MPPVPRSERFDDVYFSVADGLEETRHVFINGNHIQERWAELLPHHTFTICETGFGTGLNFLAVLKLWRERKPEGGHLHFISYEKYPVTRDFIAEHLAHWREDIGAALDDLLSVYPLDLSAGRHDILVGEDSKLSLIFGDVNVELPKLGERVDCWFLDGFKPSANPEMWSDTVFQNMARLSREGATFATFTSAGFVRRGLKSAGFEVRKVKGFGHKREMSVGHYMGVRA